MKDTPPKIQKKLNELIMVRSESERILMCVDLFDTARDLIVSVMPKDLSPSDFKRQLYERTYGEPFPDGFPLED